MYPITNKVSVTMLTIWVRNFGHLVILLPIQPLPTSAVIMHTCTSPNIGRLVSKVIVALAPLCRVQTHAWGTFNILVYLDNKIHSTYW